MVYKRLRVGLRRIKICWVPPLPPPPTGLTCQTLIPNWIDRSVSQETIYGFQQIRCRGEPTTTTTVRAMNENQTLLEIHAAIAAILDSNWSYFSAPSYMKEFFAYGIIRFLLYDDFLWPHIHMLVCNAYIWAFLYAQYIRAFVIEKMVIYFGIKTPQNRKEPKYTWQKNARISCSRNDCKFTWGKKRTYIAS